MNPLIIKTILGLALLCVFATVSQEERGTPKPTPLTPVAEVVRNVTPSPPRTLETPDGGYYSVRKVVDGDTLVVDMNGIPTTLRLIGINTPETVDPRRSVECFGKEASVKAKSVLTGAYVRIEGDTSQDTVDKYGRTLAYVFLEDGTNFNEYMIAEGYAYEYTYRVPYKYQVQFKSKERLAREEGKGLWADGACGQKNITNYEATPHSTSGTPSSTLPNTQVCDKNTYNCSNFTTQKEAQGVFDSCGGGTNDIHKLDSDKDGVVCEGLP